MQIRQGWNSTTTRASVTRVTGWPVQFKQFRYFIPAKIKKITQFLKWKEVSHETQHIHCNKHFWNIAHNIPLISEQCGTVAVTQWVGLCTFNGLNYGRPM